MVVANIARKNGPFVGDGSNVSFAFNFRLLTTDQILVTQNDAEVNPSSFTIAGGLTNTGGNVIFNAAPATGDIVWIFGDTTREQPTSYPAQGAFPALSHETGLDRNVMIPFEQDEVFERIPTFKQSSLNNIRNMEMPQPAALKLLQWNATEDGLENADSTILTITADPVSGLTFAKAKVQLTPVTGQATMVAIGLVPAGAITKSGLIHITTGFGVTNGLTGLSVGTIDDPELYGRNIALTALTNSNAGQFRNYRLLPNDVARDIVVSAEVGPFDAVGALILTAFYEIMTPDTTL